MWPGCACKVPTAWCVLACPPDGPACLSQLLWPVLGLQDSGGARRSVIGDGPQLLTHYYDDARTMYQVFRRGLSISGESSHGGVEGWR